MRVIISGNSRPINDRFLGEVCWRTLYGRADATVFVTEFVPEG